MRATTAHKEIATARSEKKKKQGRGKAEGLSQLLPGMPALDNVERVVDFVSPKGDKYKILQTTERDAYDPPATPPKKRGQNLTNKVR